ncbi:MAG: putative DNA binding domain-containing protein, partial [Brumimicrobium sp.]|nr:putative DNA binding domain-containing protein [Brumimicrobium sp.]
MQVEIIRNILKQGEGLTIEFKQAEFELPKNLFETVCAFLNREGGTILLGVDDNGGIRGVNADCAEKLCKDFANLSNNSEKLNPVFLLQPKVVELEGKKIIHVFVPSSSQVHQTRGVLYDRSSDGDFQVKTHIKRAELYTQKNTIYTENTIYPYLNESHFEDNIIEKVRKLIRLNRPAHPWLEAEGKTFFKMAGLYRTDLLTNVEGFTLAALLLLGKEEVITSMIPYYRVEALVRIRDKERYDDRLSLRTNLINVYEQLMEFIAKHLPDKFYLEGDTRISLREHIFREVIANFLIHREYINPRVSTLEIFETDCIIRNANKPHLYGDVRPTNCESFPKNPHLAKFFVQIGRAEELGTGIRKIFKYSQAYSGSNPKIAEGDIFEAIVPILTT